jgi:hypothetical protein
MNCQLNLIEYRRLHGPTVIVGRLSMYGFLYDTLGFSILAEKV